MDKDLTIVDGIMLVMQSITEASRQDPDSRHAVVRFISGDNSVISVSVTRRRDHGLIIMDIAIGGTPVRHCYAAAVLLASLGYVITVLGEAPDTLSQPDIDILIDNAPPGVLCVN